MKFLEELWYGNVTPSERSVEKGSYLWNLGRLILKNEEELAPLLNIPVAGNRQSGNLETAVPARWEPLFRRIGNRCPAWVFTCC